MPVPERHHVSGNRIEPPYPEGTELALFGNGLLLGCGKKEFWELEAACLRRPSAIPPA